MDQLILCLIAIDALLPIYSIKRNIRWGLKIHFVIGGITLLADALLRGFSVFGDCECKLLLYRGKMFGGGSLCSHVTL